MKEREIKAYLNEYQAILKGHFLLSSGLHSPNYVQCAKIFEEPEIAKFLVNELVTKIGDLYFDIVVSPAIGGIIFGYELARQMNKQNIFFERQKGKLSLRRAFVIAPQSKIIIAEDVITTGTTVEEITAILNDSSVEVVAVTSLINRSKAELFNVPYYYLLKSEFDIYKPMYCPLCKRNIPLSYLGSREASGSGLES